MDARSRIVSAVEGFHAKHGISALGFACGRQDLCRAGCSAPSSFVTAKEPLIGEEYARGPLPRILFLSLDAGDEWPGKEPRVRTMEHALVAERELHARHGIGPRPRHWYQTHDVAATLLTAATRELGLPDISVEQACRHFAHANAVRCKNLERGRRQADRVLFEQCRTFAREETALLEPHIVVTQGAQAARTLDAAFPVVKRVAVVGSQPTAAWVTMPHDSVLLFPMHHPGARWRYWQQKAEVLPWLAKQAALIARGSQGA